jgi:recombinational DNA repair ATPase RecF
MLLDDLFGELDAGRCNRILERLEEDGQCVITATDDHAFARAKSVFSASKRFMVDRGTVKEAA